MSKDRLNVVWLMSDQHAAFASGCYGHSVVRTPNIDRLAEEGLRFDRAYTPSPVCVPARFAALCGRYPHTTGCTGNNTPLPVQERTAAHAFSRAGYLTAFIGKMHPVDPQTHGFDFLVDMGHYYDYLGPKTEIWGRGMDARNTGCGLPWMEDWYQPYSWREQPLDPTMPTVLDEPDHFEAFVARNCDAFLNRYGDKPFFLFASFIKPHFPFAAPPEYHARYQPEAMILPETAYESQDVPAQRRSFLSLDPNQPDTIRAAQRYTADYFAATTYMDVCVGRILASLERLGLQDNTLVIYTSDHGEMLYHHGLTQKFVFYEQSARVPLIMRWPDIIQPGSTTVALTDLTDLLPTSLGLAEVEPISPMGGHDLSPIVRGEMDCGREACFSELGESMMLRTDQWKLAYYPDARWHLFDLTADPHERRNRYDELQDTTEIRRLRDQLQHWQQT